MKTNHLYHLILILMTTITAYACSKHDKSNKPEERKTSMAQVKKQEVTVQVLEKRTFYDELISNGKISAHRQVDLHFETNELIAHLYVKNGESVRKGQRLAELDLFRLERKLSQAEDALLRAELELKDVLIGQGYRAENLQSVPPETMKIASVKSGYAQAKTQHELSKREVERATLIAPFDGVVANLFTKQHNIASTSEPFCTIIDTHAMEADFTVLENELPLIRRNDKVMISLFASKDIFEGKVSEINPLVDANGMVKVKAKVNSKGVLFCGMNVKVSIKRPYGEMLVIPKSAVVIRSGRQVVFTLKEGKAAWNYVHTSRENATDYVVSDKAELGIDEGLLQGDTVIITGNLNLAHDTEVIIRQEAHTYTH